MIPTDRNVLFLPGATGDGAFWQGVGQRLPAHWRKQYLNWPGLGDQAPSPRIKGFSDLLDMVQDALTVPSIIVAQSMGGIIAAQLALKQPAMVTHLVLVAASGGLDVAAFGAVDWRQEFVTAFPATPSWLINDKPNLAGKFVELTVPTLLIWGDADNISPVAVGRHLASVIPQSELVIVPGGEHWMGMELPQILAPLIEAHVSKSGNF